MPELKQKASTFKLKIKPQYSYDLPAKAASRHPRFFEEALKRVIPETRTFEDKNDFLNWTKELLPLVKWSDDLTAPDSLSLVLFCRGSKRLKIEHFFLEIIKKWILPEKEVNVLSFHHLYFHLEGLPEEIFLVCEVQILVEDGRDLIAVKTQLPVLAKEVALGVSSPDHARYILEGKALSNDLKSTQTRKELIHLLEHFPNDFDSSLLSEMGRFLTLSTPEFILERSHRHLTRLICSHHLIHKRLNRAVRIFPDERHLLLRITPTRLQFPFGTKLVLGLIIGLYLADKYEFFDEKHILLAVQKIISGTQGVKGSYYSHQSPSDRMRTLYLEIEKKDGSRFSVHEMKMLKKLLIDELKAHVEKLIPALFMIRNEEEVMKNIFILSQELKYFSDLPQIMVSLEFQSTTDLTFTVILIRILKEQSKPLEQSFQDLSPQAEFIPDRTQVVGYLRKKYPKEAHVFRLKISKDTSLLRADSSVNFYLARQRVTEIITKAIGEVRDYNGGMILQQGEQFAQFRQAFNKESIPNQDLLENFFYSITPIEMQATLRQDQLHTLFHLFLQAIDAELPKKNSVFFKANREGENVFAVIRSREPTFKEFLARHQTEIKISPKTLTSTSVNFQGSQLVGYIYECADPKLQNQFIQSLQEAIEAWQKKLESLQILRLSFLSLPVSLDPRIGGEEESATVLKLLFDGLMRMGKDGKTTYAIAESVLISQDQKTYTFKLRESLWSDGSRVIAHDFEHAWKKILSPNFNTPFAYLFYPIKNAKLAKEGTCSLSDVGIQAVNDSTLIVQLEHPTSYFLELTAYPLYSPVNHTLDLIHPNWSEQDGKGYVSNGPFQLVKKNATQGVYLTKNPLYWDKESVQLDQVIISQSNSHTAAHMFNSDEIDWLGRPLRPWIPTFDTLCSKKHESYSTPRILWYVFNTRRFPFHNAKLRRAFALAINRKELLKLLSEEWLPAYTPLPYAHTLLLQSGHLEEDLAKAQLLFQEALKELGLTRKTFPIISLIHALGEVRDKTATFLKQSWQQAFDVNCRTESDAWDTFFSKMTQGDFQMGAMNWVTWINDPIYTLNAFKYGNDKINFPKWENTEYQMLLDKANYAQNSETRTLYLAKAEAILIQEMPVIPLFYEVQQFIKKDNVKVFVNSQTGNVDFRTAQISKS